MNKKHVVRYFVSIEIVLIMLFSAFATSAALNSNSKALFSGGSVITTINVDVYQDPACTQTLTSINWGNVYPASNNTQTIYIKNSGNAPEQLSITAGNWNPTNASQVLTFSYSLNSITLAPSASTPATLNLAVSANPESLTTFNFNITITGTQT
jgi:hypothetical protein